MSGDGGGIRGLETRYKGYHFRSRLEARWAVFFDALGIRYRYEPEGFDLGEGLWYLPDFWLPDQRLWVEVKGDYDAYNAQKTQDKAFRLSQLTHHDVAMLVGDVWLPDDGRGSSHPGFDAHYVYRYYGAEACQVGWDNYHWWCECPACGTIGFEFSGRSERLDCPCYAGWHEKFSCEGTPRLRSAYEQARGYRFARGSSPIEPIALEQCQVERRAFRKRHVLADVVQSVTPLHASGAYLLGACPLCGHQGLCLQVDPADQSWRCSQCGYGGDVYRFVECYCAKRRDEEEQQLVALRASDEAARAAILAHAATLVAQLPSDGWQLRREHTWSPDLPW